MKKIAKGLLILALFASSANAATNKTFLMPRSHGVNLPMEYTTWHELLQTKDDDRFGANFQVTGFYSDSSSNDDIGKYFSPISGKNIFDFGGAATATNVEHRFIIHEDGADTSRAKVTFDPEQTAYGVRIDYYQDLEKVLKGLYFKVAVPIVYVENDMQMKVSGEAGLLAVAGDSLVDYFKGAYTAALPANAVNALTHAKINGQQSETGVADIDFVLGYKFFDKEKYHASINLGLTIPVGTDPSGVYAFEPIVGNGGHWGFGGGIDFGAKLWDDGDQNLKLAFALNYRYLFEDTEKRTLGLKDLSGTLIPWGQYYGVGKVGDTATTPAANLLTKNVDVEPGSQIDAMLGLAYNNGGFCFEIGYNFFYKEQEDVSLKDHFPAYAEASTYALVNDNHDLATALVAATNTHWTTGNINVNAIHSAAITLVDANVSTAAAASESQDTHKIFAGLGYIFKDWEYPLMLSLGGGYEFAGSNDAIEKYEVYGKLGIAF